jgi:hypothetical protein
VTHLLIVKKINICGFSIFKAWSDTSEKGVAILKTSPRPLESPVVNLIDRSIRCFDLLHRYVHRVRALC